MSPVLDKDTVVPEPIAIIGTGCKFAGSSSSPSKLWELLSKPRDVASKPPANRFNIDAYYHPDSGHHGTTNTTESYFLSEDIGSFDATFFNISAAEAKTLDPQQRLLLETVYESLETAGLRLEALQGSRTGVFCGVMSADWEQIMTMDNKVIPPYAATGMARNNLANRVSYFFDWNGPSMSIDTACSASLVAVHQAVTALQQGQCTLAAAVGVNLILSPITYISTTKMQMLSPTGRSRMWDDKADGYARGEGIASVILKRLSDAIADSDPIDCIIRGTGVNQDGRSMGLTMPSSSAQLQLIQSTYAQAGLDPVNRPEDRCQYFEAHGTGTQAGDPQEASAIYNAFFPTDSGTDVLHVGSIKTVVGHTEGTAGLAGLIKASLCIKHGVIPPNLHFDNLNPKLAPFASRLKIPTEAIPWPKLPPGVPRRVSVNSFGFGGTNAHVIIESHETYPDRGLMPNKCVENGTLNGTLNGTSNGTSNGTGDSILTPTVLPFAFSSASERVLGAVLKQYASYLDSNPNVDLINLAWSLMHRRSALSHRVTLWAPTMVELRSEIQTELERRRTNMESTVITHPRTTRKRILGIFTGQGAQWAKMGHDLVAASPSARRWLEEMQTSLDELPTQYRPPFSLMKELSRPKESSRLHQAALSQPLCTALQIVFVNLLSSLGISFDYVVGHSSGEIAAAYSAGFLTARDAIRIAYLRGQVASYASANGQPGAMLASALSMDDATTLCAQPEFAGRITVAACNSPDSVTISGDANAIKELEEQLKGDNKFARLLRVDTAYHSHHMQPCAEPYLRALMECDIRVASGNSTVWFSSVHDGKRMSHLHDAKTLSCDYWKDNMVNTVLFSQALEAAITAEDSVSYLAVEVGPHPALKGPAQQTITAALSATNDIPYIGLSNRGASGIGTFASGIGSFWAHLGPDAVKTDRYVKLFDPRLKVSFVKDLPCYPFDHSQSYWYGTRRSRACLRRGDPTRTLLGTLLEDLVEGEWCWRNYLRPEELGWVDGHCIQTQTVFPATGYIAMAVEAGHIAIGEQIPSLVHMYDFTIDQAISFNSNEPNGVETFVRIDQIHYDGEKASARFTCHANIGGSLKTCASAHLSITLGYPSVDILPSCPDPVPGMSPLDVDDFYSSLSDKGYNYTGAFRELQSLSRKLNFSRGTMLNPSSLESGCGLQLHPAVMDTALQVILGAIGYPGDGELRTTIVPTRFDKITISTYFCGRLDAFAKQGPLVFDAAVIQRDARGLVGDASMFVPGGHGVFQFEGVRVAELTPRTEADDVQLFMEVAWGPLNPDANAPHQPIPETWLSELPAMEEMFFLFMKEIIEQITPEDRAKLSGFRVRAVAWFDHVMSQVRDGTHPFFPRELANKTSDDLPELISKVTRTPHADVLDAVRANLLRILLGETTLLEVMRKDNLLRRHYEEEIELKFFNDRVADFVEQIAFRYQHMKILEVGAGTASATRRVIDRIGRCYHSYTFTDISAAFFEEAQSTFAEHSDRFFYKTLDIEQDPMEQGFEEHGYDLIIAANVLHATKDIRSTMSRIRRLLRPGGYLVALEYTNGDVLRVAFHTCGFEGWWIGEEESRRYGPASSVDEWESILKDTGFSGFDTITEPDNPIYTAFSVFATQAIDDRVQRLREPLTLPPAAAEPEPLYEDLILIGGETERTSALADELQTMLKPYFRRITHTQATETLDTKDISLATALIFTEIDSTFFQELTEAKLSGFKALVAASYRLLWVAGGSEAENPYLSMSRGFLNCMTLENQPSLYQYFNVVDPSAVDAPLLATSVMRMAHTDFDNDYTMSKCLWTTELEMRLENGSMKIPRLLPETSPNVRFAATKRPVRMQLDLQQSAARVTQLSNTDFDIIEEPPRCKGVGMDRTTADFELLVRYSTSCAMRVRDIGYLYFVIGENPETHSRFLAMSDKHSSRISVPTSWCQQLPHDIPDGGEPAFLSVAASILQATDLVGQVSPNSTVLVHEADAILRSAIWTQAIAKGVEVYFTTSKKGIKTSNSRTIYFHENSSARVLRDILPKHISTLANFGETVDCALSRGAPPSWENAVKLDVGSFYRASAILSGKQNVKRVPETLRIAHVMAAQLVDYRQKATMLNVSELHEQPPSTSSLSIIDWTQSLQLSVLVQPASLQVELSPTKTYLFIGLTNDLGQSLCQWMVSRGARNVVLTSRTPQVSSEWVEMMLGLGARVIPMAMDVTDRKSVLRVDSFIRQHLPPIGGVVNGAMVLRDQMLADTALDSILSQFGPKIHGSLLVEELYGDIKDLDFFILFGSAVSIIGNWGQSPYAAATNFMTSLIYGRRKRNLVGSILHPGQILGVGYLSRMGKELSEIMTRTVGTFALSEVMLHELFAETILAGRPNSGLNPVITAGFAKQDPVERPDLIWYRSPKGWLMIDYCSQTNTSKPEGQVASVKEQLESATTMAEATETVLAGLMAKLVNKLQLPEETAITSESYVTDLGVDSLIAVDLRNWFIKELEVDVPVLKILSDATIGQLAEDATSKLSTKLLPSLVEVKGALPNGAKVNGHAH